MYYLKGAYGDYFEDEDGHRESWGTRDAALDAAVKASRKSMSSIVIFQDAKAICNVHQGKLEWLIPMKGPYQ